MRPEALPCLVSWKAMDQKADTHQRVDYLFLFFIFIITVLFIIILIIYLVSYRMSARSAGLCNVRNVSSAN